MPVFDLKTRSLDIQRKALLAELQSLLSQLENPELTREQLEKLKLEVADCQKRYAALGYRIA